MPKTATATPAPTDFDTAARACFKWLASTRESFTSDDVWTALAKFYPDTEVTEPRRMSSAVRSAESTGLVVITDSLVRSQRRANHGRFIPTYRSVVFGQVKKAKSPLTVKGNLVKVA